jgi:hypothetical protein
VQKISRSHQKGSRTIDVFIVRNKHSSCSSGKFQIHLQVWEGELLEGVPDGFGKATFPSGDIFEGTYSNGRRHGKGKYTFANGAYYEGDYADNVKEGQGTMEYPDKGKYEGEVVLIQERTSIQRTLLFASVILRDDFDQQTWSLLV